MIKKTKSLMMGNPSPRNKPQNNIKFLPKRYLYFDIQAFKETPYPKQMSEYSEVFNCQFI